MVEKSLECKFLLHTRSESFDYKWIFSTIDEKLLDYLDKYKPARDDLTEYPLPNTIFFFNSYYNILTIADISPKKNDLGGRTITHRGYLVWKNNASNQEWLKYKHLIGLLKLLKKEISSKYDDPKTIPDNDVRPNIIKDLSSNITKSEIESLVESALNESSYIKTESNSNNYNLPTVFEIVVPKTWDFNEMAMLFENTNIQSRKMFIWSGKVNETIKPNSQYGWVLNNLDENVDSIYLKNLLGNTLSPTSIENKSITSTEKDVVDRNNLQEEKAPNGHECYSNTLNYEETDEVSNNFRYTDSEDEQKTLKIMYQEVAQIEVPWKIENSASFFETYLPFTQTVSKKINEEQMKNIQEIEKMSLYIQELISPYNPDFSLLYLSWTNCFFEIHRIVADTKTPKKNKDELKKVMAKQVENLKDATLDCLVHKTDYLWTENFTIACRRLIILLSPDL